MFEVRPSSLLSTPDWDYFAPSMKNQRRYVPGTQSLGVCAISNTENTR